MYIDIPIPLIYDVNILRYLCLVCIDYYNTIVLLDFDIDICATTAVNHLGYRFVKCYIQMYIDILHYLVTSLAHRRLSETQIKSCGIEMSHPS